MVIFNQPLHRLYFCLQYNIVKVAKSTPLPLNNFSICFIILPLATKPYNHHIDNNVIIFLRRQAPGTWVTCPLLPVRAPQSQSWTLFTCNVYCLVLMALSCNNISTILCKYAHSMPLMYSKPLPIVGVKSLKIGSNVKY